MSKYGWIFDGKNEFGVMHRERGVIPDYTPAPRSGIFRPEILEDVQQSNLARAARFAFALDKSISEGW